MKQFLFLFSILFLSYHHLLSQKDWKLKKESDGITVYTKKVENSGFKAFKGITNIKTTLSTLLAVFQDIDGLKHWSYKVKHAEVVEGSTPLNRIYYVVTDAPWPVKDRDGVYQFSFELHEDQKLITARVIALKGRIPEKKNHVRIKESTGSWIFRDLNNGEVEVTYENHAEAGGSIPAWLANSSVINLPFHTLQKLKERVKLEKYHNKGVGVNF